MGQIKDAIQMCQGTMDYSLKAIASANRNISKKMSILEEKIYKETGLYVKNGEILMNPKKEECLVEGYCMSPDYINIVTHYDVYKLDENGNIIPISKNDVWEKLEVNKNDKIVIEKYKNILMEYYRIYRATKEKVIYSIKGTNLKVLVSGENSVLYKESPNQKNVPIDELNPYKTDFYINIFGDEIRIDHNSETLAQDCEEIYSMDLDEVLSKIKIEGEIPDIISENTSPVSILKIRDSEWVPGLRNGSYFKITDSIAKKKMSKLLFQILDMLNKSESIENKINVKK